MVGGKEGGDGWRLAAHFLICFHFSLAASLRRCVHAKNPIKRAIKLFRNLHIFRISTQ